jgi:hypothetical protein
MRTVVFVNDLASYFPLSQRPRRDETDVTNNWSRHRGSVLLELAGLLDELPEFDVAALREGVTIRDAVTELIWLSETTRIERWRRKAPTPIEDAALATRLRSLATDDLAGRSRNVRELGDAVVCALEVGTATGHPVSIDPVASGAVALAQGLSGPIGARAVTRERTLVATDAEWRIGRGPELEGTAAAIVLYLYGRASLSR